MPQPLVAKVKNVLSGDSVVLVPAKTNQVPAPERILALSNVRGESYAAKEYLRQLLIGKEVKFTVLYKTPSGREFGDLHAPVFDSLIEHLLAKGMVKLKENDTESVPELVTVETKARTAGLGVWGGENLVSVEELTPDIKEKSQKTPISTVVEKVISGDRVMARIIVNKSHHVVTPLLLAGIRCQRTDDENANKKIANEAKAFVEDKLLTTNAAIKVSVVGESQSGVPIALFIHPSGNSIHEKLLENGWAEIVDWQLPLLGSTVMGQLRKAEQTAKALGKGLHASVKPKILGQSSSSSKSLRPGQTVENVTIAKIVGADTVVVRLPSDEELTVQLASVRAPRPLDTTITTNSQLQGSIVSSAREFVRHFAIGKNAVMHIDGLRAANKDLGFDSRFLVRLVVSGYDLSEVVVKNGWATVIRHNKATSGERAMNWDKLIELEEEQKKLAKKGIFFSGDISKVVTVSPRIVDASENLTKAKTFLPGFKQKGRISGGYYVEYVSSANRVKLFNPKEGTKLTLVLGGLTNNKNSAHAESGLKFMNRKFLQRPVEFEVYDTDKVGSFIGNLYANSKALSPVQVTLLEQGFVATHEISLRSNKFGADMEKAEEDAKAAKKGMWSNYDAAAERAQQEANEARISSLSLEATKPKFFDIEVTDIDPSGVLSFQKLDADTEARFSSFKKKFSEFHAQPPSASENSTDLPHNLSRAPKKNELVSAKFSENGKYYRAKVVNYDRTSAKYEVKHIDFGNIDKVSLSGLRSLPSQFGVAQYPAFASTTKLQGLVLPPTKPTDYLTEALYALEDLAFDKKLVLSAVPSSDSRVDYDGIIYDAEQSLKDASYTINKQLVADGWALVDKEVKDHPHIKDIYQGLLRSQESARSSHVGCWEFGDITFDEDAAL
ncbi:hypothetical protein QFC19_004681 [Naganishia cerealis]|uniref:Uncharacterized protein n=1 Tax=Naganishia cerealis TaxID=610337 RepID=A0ACC2VU96_9TREE|nr:hypothetical protein QFC19_004681 [Naganishia cerealis]